MWQSGMDGAQEAFKTRQAKCPVRDEEPEFDLVDSVVPLARRLAGSTA